VKLYFITGNEGKFKEIQKLLPQVEQLDIDLPETQSLDSYEVLRVKILEAQKYCKDPFFVEDTSFTLAGMNGLPGTLSKWFLKSIGNDGIVKLSLIFGREARATSLIGYSDINGKISFFEGVVYGEIVEPSGESSRGFGWDPIFKPRGYEQSFGEMDQDKKNEISMRRLAIEKLREALIG